MNQSQGCRTRRRRSRARKDRNAAVRPSAVFINSNPDLERPRMRSARLGMFIPVVFARVLLWFRTARLTQMVGVRCGMVKFRPVLIPDGSSD